MNITWDGVDLTDDQGDLLVTVENLEGWYDTPEVEPNDVNRVLADGSAFGPLTRHAREITVSGAVAATDRSTALLTRRLLGQLAGSRTPVPFQVSDELGDTSALVRPISALKLSWLTALAFRFQITVRAGDPLRYGTPKAAVIKLSGSGATGRVYPRAYPSWRYASTLTAGAANITNAGNTPGPVTLTYTGPIPQSRLVSPDGTLLLAAVGDGEVIYVQSDTLAATAPGGASRANYVLPGSNRLWAEVGQQRWRLIAAGGTGTLRLDYSDTYL